MENKKNNTKSKSTGNEVLYSDPLFARFLENQKPGGMGTDKINDVIDTPKYPHDNADIMGNTGQMQVARVEATNKKKDTIYHTLKYPSDRDEFITMKYPSDDDEGHPQFRQTGQGNVYRGEDGPITLKAPSDDDEGMVIRRQMATTQWPSDEEAVLLDPSSLATMKSPSDQDEDVKEPTTHEEKLDRAMKPPVRVTMKYPSDRDEEYITLKYPSDSDEPRI